MNDGFTMYLVRQDRFKWSGHGLICVGDFMRGKTRIGGRGTVQNVIFDVIRLLIFAFDYKGPVHIGRSV